MAGGAGRGGGVPNGSASGGAMGRALSSGAGGAGILTSRWKRERLSLLDRAVDVCHHNH